jgi:hypothetical protein
MYINGISRFFEKVLDDSLCLNKLRKNLAANLERSPLTHSHGYGPAGDRPILFASFSLTKSPGGRSPERRTGTSMCYAAPALPWALRILNARQRGPKGGGQDARSNFVPFMQHAG